MKRSKTQNTLEVIATTLPGEVEKIDALTRQGKEAISAMYNAADWNEADCARKHAEKAIKGLASVAQQMAVVNVALSEAAKKSFDETFAAYEELLSNAAKQERTAYDRGVKDGRKQGETDGYFASQAEYEQQAANWRALLQ